MASAYERRDARAKAAGWKSYGELRRASERINRNGYLSDRFEQGAGESAGSRNAKETRIFYGAFIDKRTRKDNGVNSFKAKWFVGVTGQVGDYNEWEARYGQGPGD